MYCIYKIASISTIIREANNKRLDNMVNGNHKHHQSSMLDDTLILIKAYLKSLKTNP